MSRYGLLIALCLSAGCGQTNAPSSKPAQTATHPDTPITEADVRLPASYAGAIPQIRGYRDSIRKAIESGDPAAAHRPLDELDIVLGKLPAIAKQSQIPIEHLETVNLAGRELRAAFSQLHAAIDEGEQPDYAAVAESIDQAIGRLEGVTP